VVCPACSADNREGARFCKRCGAALALACPSCGAAREADQAFCDECGVALRDAHRATPVVAASALGETAAGALVPELRVASVLFVDLVGYTSLSESRDAEDVRELLGGYFERAKTIIGRYDGRIEKFIGDAVMAVWGVPTAREDDAERAVRAGLELVEGVGVFGEEVGAPQLRARAGVVTGQVASLARPGEGLVIGDRVNTASRVQSAAAPGTVFVDDITRQVTSAAIAYEDAGEHAVKGKAEPLRLFRAVRVVAGVAGAQRSSALGSPFVGRDAELRLLKDLFHATVDRGGARLVGVSGPAGVGKTRLGLELSNYVDGLAGEVWWHSGRCLSFGEGVTHWALAEMVRQRLGIAEEASSAKAAALLRAGLGEWVADPGERRRLEEALGVLIGTSEATLERDELFAGWRLFFERLAEHDPVVLVFEDMQWADDGLLDFIEQLVVWSADHPIFVCAFARPELSERRAGWPTDLPCGTALRLEPLSADAVDELLRSLVAGLPARARRRIAAQAEGIPLYAVETVRALSDRGLLEEREGGLEPAGEIDELDVPASLHSLLSARLDALAPDERELVKAMAVFGGSFPRATAVALTDLPEDRVDDVLASLVARDILTIRTDPLSPERGQYAFAQGLLRAVAYEMLAKRERKPRHLSAAEHLRKAFPNDGEEVAEVIAAHLLDAYRSAAGDPDEDELRARALAALRSGAQRAATVGGLDAAERALRTAIGLAVDERQRTELTEEAGRIAAAAGRYEAARDLFEAAAAAHAAAGRERDAARLAGSIGHAQGRLGHHEEAISRMRAALEVLGGGDRDPDVATINCDLGRALLFTGRLEEAGSAIERALSAAEALELPVLTYQALGLKAIYMEYVGRYEEARTLHDGAVAIGERYKVPRRHVALQNASVLRITQDMPGAIESCEAALAAARQRGDRSGESIAICNLMAARLLAGDWQRVERIGEAALEDDPERPDVEYVHQQLGLLHAHRGELEAARANLDRMGALAVTDDLEARHCFVSLEGLIALGEGDLERALALLGLTAREGVESQGASSEGTRIAWPDAVAAAIELQRFDEADALVALLADRPRGLVPPLLRAELSRGRALLARARGEPAGVEASLRDALEGLAALGYRFWVARAQTDLGAWLIEGDRRGEAAPLLDEAAEALQALGAEPALARARALMPAAAERIDPLNVIR
jgi:class 3 adenylate cyclase/tetratricopeptide (TPR) repeat protein